MGDFTEAEKRFRKLSSLAELLLGEVEQLEVEAMRLALEEARILLITNLAQAIAFSGEYQREIYETRLYRYFEHPNAVSVNRDTGVVINVDERQAAEDWMRATAYANYIRKRGKNLRGWAINPSVSQRRAYWRNKVYPDNTKWLETIEARLSFLQDPDYAPFWYYLEYGTGPGAFPATSPQRFVKKTRDEAGGHKLINKYMEDLINKFDVGATKAVNKVITGGEPNIVVKQEVQWTSWYTWGNKQKRHQYIPGKGGFLKGGKVEIR